MVTIYNYKYTLGERQAKMYQLCRMKVFTIIYFDHETQKNAPRV